MKEMYIKLEWNSCPDSWERRGGGVDLGKNPFHGGGMDIVWNTQYINMVIVWNQNVA